MTLLPVPAARPSLPVPAARSGQGADMGQRYEIRTMARDGARKTQALGWTDDPSRASAVAGVWRRRSDMAAAWVYDRGTIGIFRSLRSRAEAEYGHDAALDREFYWWFTAQPDGCASDVSCGPRRINFYGPSEGGEEWLSFERYPLGFWSPTRSLGDARALVRKVFPDWWVTSGLCGLSGHASIGPDYNGPARERLLSEFPVERFDGKFDCDLHPGGDEGSECRAILSCLLQARIALLQERRGYFSQSEEGKYHRDV